MSRVALLDVNVLVALFDPQHVHHEVAHEWFADNRREGWATCPLTENGFIRFLTRPASSLWWRPEQVIAHLRSFCASKEHVFWSDAASLCDKSLVHPGFMQGRRQVTDIYLLGLATTMGGRLATFDRTIPLRAVVGATAETIQIISPAE